MSVEHHGPFPGYYDFTVEGYRVPHIRGHLTDGENTWELILDRRFSIEVSDQELHNWMPFLFRAMAIAAGLNSIGDAATPINLYNIKVMQITRIEGGDDDQTD